MLANIDIRHVQKSGFFESNVDERGLHTRQHPVNLALVDITDDATAALTLDANFLQGAVFHDRYPGLLGRDV
jgi:hypothetical protein